MAVGNFLLYHAAKLLMEQGGLNLTTGSANIFAVLVTNTYVPAITTDSTYANISANEAVGSGYAAGGQVLSGVSLTNTGGVITFTSSGVTWNPATIAARYAVLLRRAAAGTPASTDPLLGYVDLAGSATNVSSTNGPFIVGPNAAGWYSLT